MLKPRNENFVTKNHHLELNYNCVQKIWEKLRKLRKSCNHKRNINRIYSERLHYNCLEQLPTLRLRMLRNKGIWVKGNEKVNCSLVPSLLTRNYTYLILLKIAKNNVKLLLQIKIFSET